MKIRTVEELVNKLNFELAWRKKELSDLKFFIERESGNYLRKQVLARCGIALLYAHWEGFIKKCSDYFLEYIAMQRLTNQELASNLLTLSFKNSVNVPIDSKKYSAFGVITSFFLNDLNKRSKIPYKSGIDTTSNLSSKIFRDIAWCIGVDYSLFEAKEKLIDKKLLGRRNHIAHGEYLEIDIHEFNELRQEVLNLMILFKNQIENIIVRRLYLKAEQSAPPDRYSAGAP